MELLDHNIIENWPKTKGNSYFVRERNITNKIPEAVNKILKGKCAEENMHFICHSNIDVKRYLNRRNLHLNDHIICALVRNFTKELFKQL